MLTNNYKNLQNVEGNPRQTEVRALLEAAKKLNDVKLLMKEPVSKEIEELYKTALRFNWRLWTIFQADLVDENNKLPNEVKVNLLQLSTFVDKRTISALSDLKPQAEKIDILININRNIASGLLDSLKNSEAEKNASPNTPNPNDQTV